MSEILSWWNLIFLLPLGLSVLFLLMNAIGLGSEGGVDSDLHTDAPTDLHEGASFDPAHDIHHDIASDHEMDHDADHDTDHDRESSQQSSSRIFLEFLGAGRIPITLIFQIFFLTWGITGWLLNLLLSPIIREPILFIWGSMTGAFFVACLATRFTSKLLWRFAPLSETYAKTHEELIGCEGEAVYKITHESGMAQVYDERGTLHRIYCRIEPEGVLIPEGNKILIVGYDGEEGLYLVKTLGDRAQMEQWSQREGT